MLGVALALTLLATAYVSSNDQLPKDGAAVVEAVKADTIKPIAEAAPQESTLKRDLVEPGKDIFSIKAAPEPVQQKMPDAAPPPPVMPVALPAPPLPPSAPPLPFTYLGRLIENGQSTVFLSANGKNYAVRKGELVAQVYRIEAIQPPLLTMTYIPMDTKQTLQMGADN